MSVIFNIDEVLQMAAQIELNGARFYRTAAESNEEGRELLTQLAEEEDQHFKIFESLRQNLATPLSGETAYDPDNQVLLYLQVMANEHVFDMNDAEKMVTDAHTLKDIIKIALQAEKDSIAFFVGLKELVPQKAGKERMGQIIREEMSHIKWLSDKVKEMEL